MRRLIIFVLFLLTTGLALHAQTTVPTSDEVLQRAYAKASANGKNILLIFHASWCGWCRKMDSSLNDGSIKPLIDKYYETVHLTAYESQRNKHLENPGSLAFLEKHGGAGKGLPYWFILDKSGAVLANADYEPGKNSGCPAAEKEVDYFIQTLQKTSGLNATGLEQIRRRFRQNENE